MQKYSKRNFKKKSKTYKKKGSRVMSKKFRKTKSKRNSKYQLVKAIPSGMSYSSCKVVYKPSPGHKVTKLMAPMSMFDNVSQSGFNGEVGRQGYKDDPFPMFQGSAINALVNSGLRQLDAAGSNITRPTLQTGQRSFNILLERAISETYFSNAGSTPCELIIYDLVAKTTKVGTANVSPGTDWFNGIDDERSGIPNTFPTFHGPNSYFAEPTQVKRFNQNWFVVKKVVANLGVGRVHKHIFDFKPQRIVDSQYSVQFQIIRGITTAQLFLARGMPADNQNSIIIGDIATSRAKIVMNNRIRYQHRVTTAQPRIYEVQDTTIDPGFLFVKEEDGDVINSLITTNYA